MKKTPTNTYENYIVFADDWGKHPSSCQHLFRQIDAPILWVNTVMRMPKLSWEDIKRLYGKVFSSTTQQHQTHQKKNLQVRRVVMIPIFNRFFRKINQVLFRMQIKVLSSHTIVTTIPIVADFIGSVKCQKKVYYCVDEFSEWPGHDKSKMLAMEKKLLKNVDIVITTSSTLYEAKKQYAPKIKMLTHGVDKDHFANTSPNHISLSKPIIGYFGLFDERTDMSLLQYMLENYPQWNIVIVGPIVIDTQCLTCYKNIHFLGRVEYEHLPEYVKNFSICMLPYHIDELTKYINPLKFKEYLSTGIPVVTTALPTLEQYKNIIGWSQNYEEFVANIHFYLSEETSDQEILRLESTSEALVGESWKEKSQLFRQHMEITNA